MNSAGVDSLFFACFLEFLSLVVPILVLGRIQAEVLVFFYSFLFLQKPRRPVAPSTRPVAGRLLALPGLPLDLFARGRHFSIAGLS